MDKKKFDEYIRGVQDAAMRDALRNVAAAEGHQDEEPEKSRLEGAPLRRLYEKAIEKWGADLQIDCAIEEMSELITELARNRRGRGRRAHVEEEIADVRIMLEQLEIIYDCAEEVSGRRRAKLERLEGRLK
jgi:hypothetical protein